MDETQPQKNDKRFSIFLTIMLALIIVMAVVLFAFSNDVFSDDENNNIPTYTTIFTNLTPKDAYNLINTTTPDELRIIDCRILDLFCHCKFASTKIDERVEWWGDDNSYEKDLYQNISDPGNITDILVYSVDGTKGAIFCENLVGHFYGKIYNLQGGQEAWAAWKRSLEN